MKTLKGRGCEVVPCVLAAAVALAACQAMAEGEEGLQKIELSSYYVAEPISTTPSAPAYSVPIQFADIANAGILDRRFVLDENAREAIERNGFVVVDAKGPAGEPYEDMVEPYVDLTRESVPVFVTSDSMLHLYHVQFDEILRCVEEKEFSPKVVTMTEALLGESLSQYESFSGDLKEAARRNVAYFTIAMKLLGESAAIPAYATEEVNDELAKIEEHAGFEDSKLFIYREDYSQYVPRGHYTRSETLKKYFKAMMWYGRMSFLLKGGPWPEALIPVEDARIQTIQASLIALALDSLESEGTRIADIWNRMYAVTAFFVGLADDLTPYEYKESILKVFGSPVNLEDFNNADKVFELKVELALLRAPEIYGGTGEIYLVPPVSPEDLDEILDMTKGMRLMGQRFIPDSYMFQNLVFPNVLNYTGSGNPFTLGATGTGRLTRVFPRGLDVMAVLGSERALTILEREGDTEYEDYDKTLNELIEFFAALTENDWNKNLYWSWLYTLKALLGDNGEGYPAFMRGKAWQDKELNTALASWTELRHDTILYAKQSYTPGETSVPPPPDRGYVEPLPEFYNRLLALTRMTRVGLDDMGVLDGTQRDRLSGLENVLSRLVQISIAELEGTELSEAEYTFIEDFGSVLKPLVEDLSDEKGAQTTLIADVHTDINSYQVLEEGVGYVKFIVVAYMVPDGRIILGAGPVFSYYEFKWPMNDRLTDEKWTEMLEKEENPPPPDWVSSFVHPVTFFPDKNDDADRDGLPDSWENSIWGSTDEVNDPDSDYDNDGCTNEEERVAGTNPRDPESCLRMLNVMTDDSGVLFRWSSIPGKRYRVSYSDDLMTWHLLGTPIGAESGIEDLADSETTSPAHRFYRVNVIP
ncbi:MAG: DUF3160 domain-containing protein [bacterium]|nr:DUF3160 domain-containing protein [bacterium]